MLDTIRGVLATLCSFWFGFDDI